MLSKIVTALALTLACSLPAFAATPVNINKADAHALASSLDGIGAAKAQAIVAWRTKHGPFKSAAELAQVKGIGESLIERNHDAILLSGGHAAPTPKKHRGKSSR